MEWNKVMNFGDPSTFGTEMADRFVASGANLPPPVSDRVKRINIFKNFDSIFTSKSFTDNETCLTVTSMIHYYVFKLSRFFKFGWPSGPFH